MILQNSNDGVTTSGYEFDRSPTDSSAAENFVVITVRTEGQMIVGHFNSKSLCSRREVEGVDVCWARIIRQSQNVLTGPIAEYEVVGPAAGLDVIITFATLDNRRSSTIHDDEVFAATAANVDGGPDSGTDFDLIVSAAAISDNRGDTAEILTAAERFNLQNFTGVVRVISQPIDGDAFVHFVRVDISVIGTTADVEMQLSFFPDRRARIEAIAGEVDRWWNLNVEEIERRADFPEQDLDLGSDVDASRGPFQPKLDGCTEERDAEDLNRRLDLAVDRDVIIAISECLCPVSIQSADLEVSRPADTETWWANLQPPSKGQPKLAFRAQIAATINTLSQNVSVGIDLHTENTEVALDVAIGLNINGAQEFHAAGECNPCIAAPHSVVVLITAVA